MKFYMALNMLDMIMVVSSRLSDVNFPFTILHDPEDGEIERALVGVGLLRIARGRTTASELLCKEEKERR